MRLGTSTQTPLICMSEFAVMTIYFISGCGVRPSRWLFADTPANKLTRKEEKLAQYEIFVLIDLSTVF